MLSSISFLQLIAPTALPIKLTRQTTLSAAFLLYPFLSLEPVNDPSHLLFPPPLFIFISSANTAKGKIKIQRIAILYLLSCANSFLLTLLYFLRCPLKTPAKRTFFRNKKEATIAFSATVAPLAFLVFTS